MVIWIQFFSLNLWECIRGIVLWGYSDITIGFSYFQDIRVYFSTFYGGTNLRQFENVCERDGARMTQSA